MPSYTHLRRAQPVLVAHFFLSHASALRRDIERLARRSRRSRRADARLGRDCRHQLRRSTPSVSHATLGFSRVVLNSMDASSDRDFVASFLYAASLAMVHLSRIAEDLIIFTGEEHGFFELSDASATGSSMMPQKKNPDPLELVRGKTGRAIGRLTGWLATMKGLPTGYNKDLQEDKEAVFDAEDTLAASLAATHAVVSRLSINAERSGPRRLGPAAGDRRRRLPRRRAVCRSGGRTKSSAPWCAGCSPRVAISAILTLSRMAGGQRDVRDDAPRAATALASVQAKRTPQSTNPEAVRAALDECRSGSQSADFRLSDSARLLDAPSAPASFSDPHPERNAPGEFMQQRRLRLGDILDDYCPRERRITNHAVVAMIEDEVKQTRCTTCDADHEYKQAKAPAPRRKKPGPL